MTTNYIFCTFYADNLLPFLSKEYPTIAQISLVLQIESLKFYRKYLLAVLFSIECEIFMTIQNLAKTIFSIRNIR